MNEWSHVAITVYYDETTDESTLQLYINGEIVGTSVVDDQTLRNPFSNRPLVVGARTHTSWSAEEPRLYFNGWIDEARISNTRRSDAWIKTSYNNQKNDSNLIVIGTADSKVNWYRGWRYRRKIRIKGDEIAEDLHDFPLLVRLKQENFDFDLADSIGRDIRFTDAAGANPLTFEREVHDSASRQAAYWVKIPLLPAGTGTNIYVYHGRSGTTDASSPETWDNSHVAVWHLGQSEAQRQDDSTRNAHDLTVFGDITERSPGVIGQAVELAGTAENPQFLMAPTNPPYPSLDISDGLTYSAWVRPSSGNDSSDSMIIAIGGTSWAPYWGVFLFFRKNNYLRGFATGHGTSTHPVNHAGMSIDNWNHVAMTLQYDAAKMENTLLLYLNGVEVSKSVTDSVPINPIAGRPLMLGSRTQASWPGETPYRFLYVGGIDEARISVTRRSAAWLAASYHSQKADSDMLSFDPREPPVGSVVLVR